ncbi:OLC1v1023711C4 [Oldenlandia corymbosa var. corymbosa]|uniref:CL1 n=1 Tax=Oldenlandia corymbosa var. corymbosa TaxID=529605 RepID=A0AAV1C108_OLDCO|nr:OLC1v1023711C4 [Oldenlandia corymbosa var. corymbosa]
MSAFKHLLNRAHLYSQYCSTKTTRPELSFLLYLRPFSSSPPETTSPPPEANDLNSNRRTPISIQPVSYAIKKPENPPPANAESQAQGPAAQSQPLHPPETVNRPGNDVRPENIRAWTREDFRYVKDVPNVSPISYPTRVAPLPEDRVATEEGQEGDGRNVEQGRNDELERERRRIDAENQSMMMRRNFSVEGEKVPFPTLIRSEQAKKKEKIMYDLKEAIRFVKANAKCNFEETVEAHVKLTPELRKSHLNLTGSVLLPHGCGKKFQIAVFAEGDAAEEAREAGAACVGGKDLVDRIKSGEVKFKFDKCFATHDMMVHVKKIGKFLKRGMMPNPEHGTLTDDMSKAVRDAITKHIIFQKDKSAIVHVPLGKVTYSEDAIRENIGAFANALLHAKPAGLKKSKYTRSFQKNVSYC